jgi:cytochrome c-type biogenesis protein CcmH
VNRSSVRGGFAVLVVVLAIGGPVFGTDAEQEARALEAMLIAPCCFSQQVSVHRSAAADEVRQDIRTRLAAGETRDEILDAYVAQYGKRVLAQPPAEGIDRVLYILPPLAFVLTAAVMVVIVRRFTASRAARAPVAYSAPGPVNERYRAELDEELRDLD